MKSGLKHDEAVKERKNKSLTCWCVLDTMFSRQLSYYHKNSNTRKIAVIILKFEQGGFTVELLSPQDAQGFAFSVDTDHTAPVVCSVSTLFTQTCLSETLGPLQY